ncbi:MAG: NHLP bacteriocin export ABC transporter permease/ATPase subunit [Chloroflexi bacterium]|nr:NHLP bacteriocin export ABC transporter permease/ATPase subunit [Chloroflexota bacterium]
MPDDKRPADTSEEWELFLLALRYRESRLVTLSGNEPFLLSGDDNAWLVYSGSVDIFALQTEGGTAAGARYHLFRAFTHQLLLGADISDHRVALLANCAPETQILRFTKSRLQQLIDKPENAPIIITLLENWIQALSAGMSSTIKPKDYKVIEPDKELALDAGTIARTPRQVVWVQQLEGSSRFLGRDDLTLTTGEALVPLSDRTWLQAAEPGRLQAFSTPAVLKLDPKWTHLDQFNTRILNVIERDLLREKQAAGQMIRAKVASDAIKVQTAVSRLAATWSDEQTVDTLGADISDPLLAACRMVGDALGLTVKGPPDYDGQEVYQDPLAEIARASRVRTRTVLLREDWWRKDNGPLLVYRGEDHRPAALLPGKSKEYELHDPILGEVSPITEELAAQLSGTAVMFYRPFPDRPLNALDLLRFGQRGARRDVLALLVVGLAGGALAMLTPIITGVIFGRLIPGGEQSQLLVFGGVLTLSAVAVALFQVARSIVLLRIESRSDGTIQAAIWDRLLSLSPDFFRRYSPGDLAQRAMGVGIIKQTLSGSVALALLAGMFSWFNLLLMLYYDSRLALITLLLVIVFTTLTTLLGARLLRDQRAVTHTQGEISGLIVQIIGGISKLRVAGAEGRSFFLWANAFSRQKKLAFRVRSTHNSLTVLIAGYPILAWMAVFAVVYNQSQLSTGEFLAFNAAFTQFLFASMQFGTALVAALSIIPVYERLKPIIQTLPEVDEQKAHPGELSGAIEVSHVSFRYSKEGPLVLDDVTFSVSPGEFVALVGTSGSGKSTLLRHLLGFERPDSGDVYYDGQALSEIDLRAVRRQIGVVLQHSQVMTGTVQDNILGASRLTVEDAWEAARKAGIAPDIKQMPMGMQTYISEGGSTFSGGQRQRLLIARALVTRPRIIFFDEATSALDDRSQALVTESLKKIDATRIVIAHRLSTIVDADRILVMQRGRLVESGTYVQLLAKGGVFTELAQRQLV